MVRLAQTEVPFGGRTASGGLKILFLSRASRVAREDLVKDPKVSSRDDASTATPGQAGLPAEFKHINKRRKRNLQGFP